jgi:hypothetical protein
MRRSTGPPYEAIWSPYDVRYSYSANTFEGMGLTSKHGLTTDDATILYEHSSDLRGLISKLKSVKVPRVCFPPLCQT